jgi:hypothetical protein
MNSVPVGSGHLRRLMLSSMLVLDMLLFAKLQPLGQLRQRH